MSEHIIENEEIMENEPVMEVEESPFDRLQGLTAEVNQMERMIEENIRLIAEGDDVEGRTFLKKHLEERVAESKVEINKLKEQIAAEAE